MNVIETNLQGVVIIEPKVFGDNRGFFMETWNQEKYEKAGLSFNFVQDNLSFSTKGVLRGLHFQNPNPQGKLVYVLQGEVFDVAVDIRVGSPTFGQWTGVTLSSENKRQFYVPEGFAHGFCVLSDTALFAYKCTDQYNPQTEGGIFWNDPDIGIEWPIMEPILSDKDNKSSRLKDICLNQLFKYR
ncbi:dTDP-4-dehydrorhamnose 3,5-epimerase [Anaerospora hongkongensis]|uniref:dTDP-4-dehydrorhamnose 3,5-epimerase n=1 Tax=Anaerospora hongkongensis TaxID=244830 RepID=UPI00289B3388|nr:dTDP-4-dehydrorhamnose 3,5-epimerase [Anaerospora hongkongensis]